MKTFSIVRITAVAALLCLAPSIALGINQAGGRANSGNIKAAEFVDGEVLVKFRHGVDSKRAARVRERFGLKMLRRYPRVGAQRLAIKKPGLRVKQAVKLLNESPDVLYAEPNYRRSIFALPNDPRTSELWGLNNIGQTGGASDADIDAPEAWDITTGSSDIVVGVIDTGVDYTHPDLAANMWTNPGEIPGNLLDDDGNGVVDDVYGLDAVNDDGNPMDDNGHGTHVSGLIGAVGNNGTGVVGVNWNVKIMALKFLDSAGYGSDADAVECLDYAIMMKTVRGVNIKLTSNSWGGGPAGQALKDAIEAAGAAGVLFVAAAGNDGIDNDSFPHYPSGYDLPNIISVAATNQNDELAWFSNYGAESVDLGAPGVNILSTAPGGAYSYFEGTSMAAPYVAGAAALVWADDPALNHLDVKQTLLQKVDPLPALNGKTLSGGRLNVFSAVTCDPAVVEFRPSLSDGFFAEQGRPQTITAQLTACGFVEGAVVTAAFSNGDPGEALADDGVAPDELGDDGTYTGSWTPDALGPVTVTFTALDGGQTYTSTATSQVLEFQGYLYDSVPYDWIEISATGTPVVLLDDDHAYIATPFPLKFYGVDYDHISINSNGLVYFAESVDDFQSYSNECIPGESAFGVDTFIAALWDDLNPEAGGQAFHEVRGVAPNRTLIVEYMDFPAYVDIGAVSFEIVFYENSDDILVQYKDVDFGDAAFNSAASATVGMQRDAAYGQQYSCSEASLSDRTALLWFHQVAGMPTISVSPSSLSASCSLGDNASSQSFDVWNAGVGTISYSITDDRAWLQCSPSSGSSSGEYDSITVNYSTSGLNEGTHVATIAVADPAAPDSPQQIIVTLTVSRPTHRLTASVSPSGAGGVSGAGAYLEGQTAIITAHPNSGWAFDHWTGAGVEGSTANPDQLTMDSDKSVTAVFLRAPLSLITLDSPLQGMTVSYAPTFVWRAEGGTDNVFQVEMALSYSGPIYRSPIIRDEASWQMPQAMWNAVPSGSYVYWRVRGADMNRAPLFIVHSAEIRRFYKD